jgi:hypothetical protein
MRLVTTLLLAAVAATGCAAQATSTAAAPTATTSAGSSATAGGPVDACKYLTQAGAESMLGVPTGPGKPELVSDANATCAHVIDIAFTI